MRIVIVIIVSNSNSLSLSSLSLSLCMHVHVHVHVHAKEVCVFQRTTFGSWFSFLFSQAGYILFSCDVYSRLIGFKVLDKSLVSTSYLFS